MKITITSLLAIVFLQSFCFGQESTGRDIRVVIKNLDNNDGKVFISLYDKEKAFLEHPIATDKLMITNQECQYTFKNVPSGIYAVSFFHDENDNDKMDSNFLGVPKEDYGCSNNARGVMGPPKWEDAKFEVKNKNILQTISL